MVVQTRVSVARVAIAAFGVATPTSATFFRSSPVPDHAFVAARAVPPRSAASVSTRTADDLTSDVASRCARATTLTAISTRRRPRCLSRRTPLLPLTIGGGRFLWRPRTVEQLLKLVERRRADRAALSAMNREPQRTVEGWQLAAIERTRKLLGQPQACDADVPFGCLLDVIVDVHSAIAQLHGARQSEVSFALGSRHDRVGVEIQPCVLELLDRRDALLVE